MNKQDNIIHLLDPQAPQDTWAKAFVINTRMAQLYAGPVEKLIKERGGHLYAQDGLLQRAAVNGVQLDTRA